MRIYIMYEFSIIYVYLCICVHAHACTHTSARAHTHTHNQLTDARTRKHTLHHLVAQVTSQGHVSRLGDQLEGLPGRGDVTRAHPPPPLPGPATTCVPACRVDPTCHEAMATMHVCLIMHAEGRGEGGKGREAHMLTCMTITWALVLPTPTCPPRRRCVQVRCSGCAARASVQVMEVREMKGTDN